MKKYTLITYREKDMFKRLFMAVIMTALLASASQSSATVETKHVGVAAIAAVSAYVWAHPEIDKEKWLAFFEGAVVGVVNLKLAQEGAYPLIPGVLLYSYFIKWLFVLFHSDLTDVERSELTLKLSKSELIGALAGIGAMAVST